MKNKNYITYKCECGEEFGDDGWNIKEKVRCGNHYHVGRLGSFRVKYTLCNKCKGLVILFKERFA